MQTTFLSPPRAGWLHPARVLGTAPCLHEHSNRAQEFLGQEIAGPSQGWLWTMQQFVSPADLIAVPRYFLIYWAGCRNPALCASLAHQVSICHLSWMPPENPRWGGDATTPARLRDPRTPPGPWCCRLLEQGSAGICSGSFTAGPAEFKGIATGIRARAALGGSRVSRLSQSYVHKAWCSQREGTPSEIKHRERF